MLFYLTNGPKERMPTFGLFGQADSSENKILKKSQKEKKVLKVEMHRRNSKPEVIEGS